MSSTCGNTCMRFIKTHIILELIIFKGDNAYILVGNFAITLQLDAGLAL